MSFERSITLFCDADRCSEQYEREEVHQRDVIRAHAARDGWAQDGKFTDYCPEHAEVLEQ
jgi:hypothetical protein